MTSNQEFEISMFQIAPRRQNVPYSVLVSREADKDKWKELKFKVSYYYLPNRITTMLSKALGKRQVLYIIFTEGRKHKRRKRKEPYETKQGRKNRE